MRPKNTREWLETTSLHFVDFVLTAATPLIIAFQWLAEKLWCNNFGHVKSRGLPGFSNAVVCFPCGSILSYDGYHFHK